TLSAEDARGWPESSGTARSHQLRGDSRELVGIRVVRLATRSLHRRETGKAGEIPTGRGWHIVLRRDRRDEPGGAGEIATGIGRSSRRSARRHTEPQGEYPRHSGNK